MNFILPDQQHRLSCPATCLHVALVKTEESQLLISNHKVARSHIFRSPKVSYLAMSVPFNSKAVSGHAPGNKEFFRYVAYSRAYLDQSVQLYRSKMRDKDWKGV